MIERLAAALVLAPVSCLALDVSPNHGALIQAVAEGQSVAAAANGYDAREYLIYAVADARNVLPDQGSVDAVVLLTPLERLRHTAYLRATSGIATEPTTSAAKAIYVPHEIAFRVFAHGADAGDGEFTQRFSVAALRMGARTLMPSRIDRSPASIGRYPLAARERERPVGTVTYWFDVTGIPDLAFASAMLSFRDAESRAVDLFVDFADTK